MFNFIALAALSLAASSVSALVVPRTTPPAGWSTNLEPYDTYHARYMAIQCYQKHDTPFFESCCHPLLATESLATARPAQCIPSTTSSSAPATSTASPAVDLQSNDGDDDGDEYCDDGDDGDDPTSDSSSAPSTPATTGAPSVPTTTPVNAPPPQVTTPAPAATPAPATSGSNVNTGGFATFFYQNGVAGACGTVHSDNDMIAAIDGERYGDLGARSSLCGKQVRITNTKNQKTVTVTIADACPTCNNGNSIDLSSGAFQQIATFDEGIVPITWEFV